MRNESLWRILGTLTAGALLVAACSGSSHPVSSRGTATSTTTTASAASTSTTGTAASTSSSGSTASSGGTPRPAATTTAPASASASGGTTGTWTTYFHDSGRSGVATDGPANPSAVRRLWTSAALDGEIYAQPLVVGGVVIEATQNDTVYALDATTGSVKWSAHLGSPVSSGSLPCGDVTPVVGITSTPVVDVTAGRVYAVGLVQPGRDVLFALNLTTGAMVASTAVDPPNSSYTTDNQRGALALDNGAVLVPFGGRYGDCGSYHGRLTSVPVTAAGLGSPSYYTVPTANEGGFWAPPGPVVASDGSIYLTTGNSSSASSYDYGNSVLRLSPSLSLIDSFAPSNWASLNSIDSDLGSTNPVLVGSRVFQVGKAGVGYLLDAGHLGGISGQLTSGSVCPDLAMGGVSHSGTMLFVPCPSYLAAVSVAGDKVAVAWRGSAATPGPAIVTNGAVWTVATGSGKLVAFSTTSGATLSSQTIGSVPSRFTSPAAGDGRVVVAVGTRVMAFGD